MLYVQLKSRAALSENKALTIGDVADVADEKGKPCPAALTLNLQCPKKEGVWTLPAIAVLNALAPLNQPLTILGETQCYIHIVPDLKRNKTRPLRAALAFLLLLMGSALAITWFHADVNMLSAQKDLYRFLTGSEPANILLIVIPYALGVGLGVALFYSLIGHKKTVSPLDIQLDKYRQDAEKTAGETP